MANASAEKLKALGLRHGEKVVVGLAVAACIACLAMAATQPTIDLTPEEVEQHARWAKSNLKDNQSPQDILKRLEEANIKNAHFEQMVDDKEKNALVASAFAPPHPYNYPQPGAGLIRDMPELIAPTELVAYPGRGGALVFELDENNQRIVDTEKMEAANTTAGASPADPHASGRGRRRGDQVAAAKKKEAKKEAERAAAKAKALLAGTETEAPKQEEAQPAVAAGPFKETTKGLRWVVLTGILDYKKLRENYLNALKVPAYPHFKQLEVERQTLQPDGSWSPWEPVDADRNHTILDNLPEVEEEYAARESLLDALVDPLPFLKAGLWQRVHVARLVPKEKIASATKAAGVRGESPGMGYNPAASASYAQPRPSTEMGSNSAATPGMAGAPEESNFQHTEAETVMLRSLDFTVEPDKSYRFHARVVVFNPNRDREDVSPDVDTQSVELHGPWSEPTNEVTMPADVTAYVVRKGLSATRRNDQVQFDVTRWDPRSGISVEKPFEAWPGEIVGEYRKSVDIPSSEGTGKKSAPIDFNSHEVVLDSSGGDQLPPPIPGATGRVSVPVNALLVRADGSVILRSQSFDVNDEVRKDIVDNYKRELEDSNKKRESSMGNSYPGASHPTSR
jgi:hypothetical protein